MTKKVRTHPHGRYEAMPPISRVAAMRALKSKNKSGIIRALIRLALNDPEWRWVQERCVAFLGHKDAWVRGAAATSLGHLARIHRRLDIKLVKSQLERLADDPKMGDKARDALDDIGSYIAIK